MGILDVNDIAFSHTEKARREAESVGERKEGRVTEPENRFRFVSFHLV